ncbi:hypothetical protein [Sphingobium sp. Leaf26]|uniref:hypothetical protein n=1 Tax=Sphingobium sp. Leaf26 TaxID=1735693 RepID=UPI0019100D28|nr:hypothetical protein [Sphingobium sp. Leaf26]
MRRHGVRHIIAATTLGRDTPWQERAGNATGSIHMIDLLRTTGAAVRGLALPGFMDNALLQAGAIRQGKMFGPIDPDKKLPHTATRDTGAAAAGLLIDRSWSEQEDVPVLGPEELSYADLAAIVSDVIGREVRTSIRPTRRTRTPRWHADSPMRSRKGMSICCALRRKAWTKSPRVKPPSSVRRASVHGRKRR